MCCWLLCWFWGVPSDATLRSIEAVKRAEKRAADFKAATEAERAAIAKVAPYEEALRKANWDLEMAQAALDARLEAQAKISKKSRR